MSSIKTTEIEGDVSIGRHVNIGGNANVLGNTTIKKNLKVEGWLDARNIKGPNKGIFLSAENLRAAYPLPHDGWWALVGNSLPAPLYVADGGAWVATGESAGNPTIDSEQYNDAVAQLDADLKSVAQNVSTNTDSIRSLQAFIGTIGTSVNTNSTDIANLKTRVERGEEFVRSAGKAGGVATLDSNGKVPAAQLPGFVDDVVEFHDVMESADMIPADIGANEHTGDVVYLSDFHVFALYIGDGMCYDRWDGGEKYGTPADRGGYTPESDKVYMSKFNKTYRWSGSTLVTIGSDLALGHTESTAFPGNEGHAVSSQVASMSSVVSRLNDKHITLVNLSSDGAEFYSLTSAVSAARGFNAELGTILLFLLAEETAAGVNKKWVSYQWKSTEASEENWDNLKLWEKFGGGTASVGNTYNVTVEQPLPTGEYYSDIKSGEQAHNVIDAILEAGVASLGLQITFAIGVNSWKTYQYTGVNITREQVLRTDNWIDLAGMSAGGESVLNINNAFDDRDYTLSTAVDTILKYEESTGIEYRKEGLVITYRRDSNANAWETKQYVGKVADMTPTNEKQWVDFGGAGGAVVEATDVPSPGSKEPFSAGGAYNALPSTLAVNTEEQGVVKLKMVNAAGEDVGDEVQFAVGTGGGGEASGTIVTIAPEESPLYAKAGGNVQLKASIRSITTVGAQETSNMIERVELVDRDTQQTVEVWKVNKASSADAETFDFVFDLSKYFTIASQKRYKMIAYDDTERSGSRNINVTAVDVTIKSEQTLHWTSTTQITEGGAQKTPTMYKFPNNASDKGIECTTEIWLNGEWKELGKATITDTYTKNISINPNNCCGEVLTHGSYALRIHGVDIASGVVGNYLHTSIMVINPDNEQPIVATRWLSNYADGEVKQYESVSVEYAVYKNGAQEVATDVIENGVGVVKSLLAKRGETSEYKKRVQGYKTDGSHTMMLSVRAGGVEGALPSVFRVKGSLLNIEEWQSQLVFDMDMRERSNTDEDKRILGGGYELTVHGANYSSNGFIKDSFGNSDYGTEKDSGEMALRIAENVKGELNYKPFFTPGIENNGLALQFRIRTKHIEDDTAKLISCYDGVYGFYVTGKRVVFTTDGEESVSKTIEASLKDDSVTDVAIVIGKANTDAYAGIGNVYMYFDGELIGACYYTAGALSRHEENIKFDGTHGDLYLYNIRAWDSVYKFEQSFNNYLLKMNDSVAMINEYEFNSGVMASQTAGDPNNPFGATRNRPQAQALYDIGIPYFVITKNAGTDDRKENYPEYIETLDGDKKTPCVVDCYFYDPARPWQNFVAIGVTMTNQGTTSSKRPVKNIKMKFKKCKEVRLLYTREQIAQMFPNDADVLAKYDECAKNAAAKKVQPKENSVPTNIITVKVDYSESGGANNGASATLYNELQIALGPDFMTPAQNAYTGKYTLGTSIDSIPCAFFRTDIFSPDATLPSNGYFHAKGNWNDDKGDAAVFGFEKCDGYNKGCLNYGDFYEVIAPRAYMGRFEEYLRIIDKNEWNTLAKDETTLWETVIVTEFCGPKYKVYRKQSDGSWLDTTGTMRHNGNAWVITGDVFNPVENFEIKTYYDLSWFQGVNTVDDMFNEDGTPRWITNFESRYPDNDELNAAYEDGRKVPYTLFNWLRWCNQCNHRLDESAGNITIDGLSVPGTKENRAKKFARELHKVANVHSAICYLVFTDYVAAVDQRSKNMMIGFYLDKDGVVRMYLNHLYDGDTVLEADNDCGKTIPVEIDPNDIEVTESNPTPSGRYYQGWDSVLFRQLANCSHIWIADYTGDSDVSDNTKTTTVAAIAKKMREVKLASGLQPFSPKGIDKYWITDRLSKWPKLVSSFDGMRKYIEYSKSSANYYYALHGLSIQRLQDYVATRFRFRDAFYKCGDIFSSQIAMRCAGRDMTITVKAAKDGLFGIGVDRQMELRDSKYLKAGESYTLRTFADGDQSGTMLYVYGADRIGELDLRNVTPKQSAWDISALLLVKKMLIGGEDYVGAATGTDPLTSVDLGQLPFLEEIDVRNTAITSLNTKGCPRLKKVLAEGSRLSGIQIAETSPIETLHLPATMRSISFVNLPNLVYPGDSLTFEGFANVSTVHLSGCDSVKNAILLKDMIAGGARIKEISIPHMRMSADDSVLKALMDSGAKGIGTSLSVGCDGLSGEWILTKYQDDDALIRRYGEYFPLLTVLNAQYTCFMYDDVVAENNTQNITNMDNGTTGDEYVPSGHIVKVTEMSHAWKASYDTVAKEMVCRQISDSNYTMMADGSVFDPTDNAGEGFDVLKNIPEFWYKGVNDYKNQKKYYFVSSLKEEPLSTATRVNRVKLADCKVKDFSCVYTRNGMAPLTKGDSVIIADNAAENLYEIDVEGMLQVRWPGVLSDIIGAVFVDAEGKVVRTFNLNVAHALFDFIEGEYVFCDVPDGAVKLLFSTMIGYDDLEAYAVDSAELEAIEPDWVRTEERLVGVYQISLDARGLPRSLSGRVTKCGNQDADNATSPQWKYDKDGNVTNVTPPTDLVYSMKDFMNLCEMRGPGYQSIDYEMRKDLAQIIWAIVGDRDVQAQCGYGCGVRYTSGSWNLNNYGNTTRITGGISGQGNLMWGLQCFVACNAEWMTNVGINIPNYKDFKKNKLTAVSGYQVTNPPIWHIFDPSTDSERTVKGTAENSGKTIARTRHGRFCDIIASRVTSIEKTDVYYSDWQWYSAGTGRVVGCASSSASAYGGLACANANSVSSRAVTVYGSRLAFRGKIRKIE